MTSRRAPSSSSAEVRFLHPTLAESVFEQFRSEIARACEESGFLEPDDTLALVHAGRLVPLVVLEADAVRGLALYEFRRYPKRLILAVVMLVGDGFDAWGAALVDKLKDIAELSGSAAITSEGRNGWLKVARKLGFATMRKAHLVMETPVHGQGRQRSANGLDERAVAPVTAATHAAH